MKRLSSSTRNGSVGSLGSMGTQILTDSKESTSRNRTWRLILVAVLPVIGLIIQNSMLMATEVARINTDKILEENIDFGLELETMMHFCQIEEAGTILFLNADNKGDAYAVLSNKHSDTDNSFLTFFTHSYSERLEDEMEFVKSVHEKIKSFRNRIWGNEETDKSATEFYATKIAMITNIFGDIVQNIDDGDIWKSAMAYYFLLQSKENWGIVEAVGTSILSHGKATMDEYARFCFGYANGNSLLQNGMQFDEKASQTINREYTGTETEKTIISFTQIILNNSFIVSNSDVQRWYKSVESFIGILHTTEKQIHDEIYSQLEHAITTNERLLAFSIVLVIISTLLFPIVIILVMRLTSTIRGYASALKEHSKDLKRERKKTETLLHEILPISIAEKLMNKENIPPEQFTSATIYFSDIVGFTDISANSTPIQVVDMLNLIYMTFDRRLELFDVYKVETIGDAYMVASGLPERNGLQHSAEIALLSLDLMSTVSSLAIAHMPDEKLKLKVGLNTGPVVGGVVGLKTPRYCLFGDTVNTASRMESCGLPNKIHLSARTHRALLEDHEGFLMEERGEIDIKVKCTLFVSFEPFRIERINFSTIDCETEWNTDKKYSNLNTVKYEQQS